MKTFWQLYLGSPWSQISVRSLSLLSLAGIGNFQQTSWSSRKFIFIVGLPNDMLVNSVYMIRTLMGGLTYLLGYFK